SHNFATASDPFTSREQGLISIFDFPEDDGQYHTTESAPLHTPKLEIPVDELDKATCLGWTIVNQHILAGFDTGTLIKYDAETGQEVVRKRLHEDRVNSLSFDANRTLFITASKDTTSKLVAAGQGKFETRFFHYIYEEEFGRVKGHFGPVNALGIHPQGKSYASGAEDG
ncbi:tif34, partial [Symbiodinium microadriaticum]